MSKASSTKKAAVSTALGVALGVLVLTGCTGSATGDPSTAASATAGPEARTEALWAGRTAYVGDNSKVIALVDAAGFGPRGTYTLCLWTTRPPYAVTIDRDRPGQAVRATDFSEPATLLLGTVRNLDAVHVTSRGRPTPSRRRRRRPRSAMTSRRSARTGGARGLRPFAGGLSTARRAAATRGGMRRRCLAVGIRWAKQT